MRIQDKLHQHITAQTAGLDAESRVELLEGMMADVDTFIDKFDWVGIKAFDDQLYELRYAIDEMLQYPPKSDGN